VNPELPHIVAVDETVVVHAPNGVHTIKNPLHCYNFNPVYKDFGDGGEDEEKVRAVLRCALFLRPVLI
jgi:hypothetical protein